MTTATVEHTDKLEDEAIPAPPALVSRAAKAAGVGVGACLIVCCTVPAVAALAFGAGAAASVAFLGESLWIGVGMVALALPAWFFLGRKQRASGSHCGCAATTEPRHRAVAATKVSPKR